MSRPPEPWRPNRWTNTAIVTIRKRVERHREELAESVGLTEPTEIDGLVEEVILALVRARAFLADVDRVATPPQQREQLVKLNGQGTIRPEDLDALDPLTQIRIGRQFAGGLMALLYGPFEEGSVRQAVEAALEDLPTARRGRPAGFGSFGLRQLALETAAIFQRHCGALARGDNFRRRGAHKPFNKFATLVYQMLPPRLRSSTSKRGIKLSENFIKLGRREWRKALESGRRNPSLLRDEDW